MSLLATEDSVTEVNSDDRVALSDLPRAASLFVIVVTSLYVAAALWVAPQTRLFVLTALVPVFILAALVRPVPHPLGGILAANSGASMVAVLVWTPPEVLLGVGIGSMIGQRIFRRAEWWRAANNAASWGLSGGVDAAAAQSIMSILPPGIFRIGCGALAAMMAHFVTNRAMFALYRSCRFQRPFLRGWRQSFAFSLPQELLELPVVVAIAAIVFFLNDLRWSLAITPVTTLLVPLERWMERSRLDVTMRRRAKVVPSAAVLWQSEPRFRVLVDHLSEGVSLINADGTILYISPSALHILGYPNLQHVGRSWFEMHHPEDSGRLKVRFTSLVADPGSHFTADTRILHTDGSWRWVRAIHTNLLMEPSIQAIVVTYCDITQARRSEETLEEYAARLEDLSRRLVQTQEVERRRIAQELHDETGQILTGLKLTLDVAVKQVGESEARSTLFQAAAMLETLRSHVRTLSLNLRPSALDDLGLLPAVLSLCDQYTAQTSVRVKISHSGIMGRRFASELETTAYRIIQEGLTNVARHARISEATVRLWVDEAVLGIQVEDSGQGFAIGDAKKVDRSSGLTGMRERASLVGGDFTIESALGVGTRVTCELPLGELRICVPAADDGS
jgi:PAS domain S-box-containing protein